MQLFLSVLIITFIGLLCGTAIFIVYIRVPHSPRIKTGEENQLNSARE